MDNEQGQTIELQLESATAVLDEYPLTASGNLLVQDGDVTIDNLLLESEANQLTLSGGYSAEQADIRWQLQAPVLEQFIPGVSAVARGRGYLRGNLAAPEIDADIELSDVSTEAGRVELVQLQVSGDPDGYQGAVELLNAVLSGQDLAISSANLDFQGTRDAHDVLRWQLTPIAAVPNLISMAVFSNQTVWTGQAGLPPPGCWVTPGTGVCCRPLKWRFAIASSVSTTAAGRINRSRPACPCLRAAPGNSSLMRPWLVFHCRNSTALVIVNRCLIWCRYQRLPDDVTLMEW